jgi:hypothetical protein
MPLRQIAGTDAEYHLISFDKDGVERREDDGTLESETVLAKLADPASAFTDIFLSSHGWKGDIPAAIEQYDKWVGAMAHATADRNAAAQARPGFKALVIGFHWPSLPYGDEDIPMDGAPGVLSGTPTSNGAKSIDAQVDAYADRIVDTPAARNALRTIFTAAQKDDGTSPTLPANVRAAYEQLYKESGLGNGNVDAAPGCDHEQWDPEAIYQEARTGGGNAPSPSGAPGLLGGNGFGSKLKETLLSPLRQASFWKMKDRARIVGESGGHELLRRMQLATKPNVHFHLMGHSFGCIVVSATIVGKQGSAPLPRPIDSLVLVQGALSLWSYCGNIPYASGKGGYFNTIVARHLVRGPIVTTRSSFDTAVGSLYPKAAGLKRQLVLGDEKFPKYGGIGTFGIQGLGNSATDVRIGPATTRYGFTGGRVYNVEASGIIKTGGGFSGAHSDIAHPEVAHIVWEAALAK